MSRPCSIVATEAVFPQFYATQPEVALALKEKWPEGLTHKAIDRLCRSSMVKGRHISMPVENYIMDRSFKERNDEFIEIGLNLAEQAVKNLLDKACVKPEQISKIIFTTVTGLAVPSIDARLMNRLPFSPNLKRLPIFGLGCVAGAAGIARAFDYLAGHPDEYVILLAIELCSLTLQSKDLSMANLVASSLFGDGSAAVLLAGEIANKSGPKVIDSRSFFFPSSEEVMGWDISGDGFKIVLNAEVPHVAREKIPACVDELLSKHHLHRNDVAAWIAHPGGPKVIKALAEGLGIGEAALKLSSESLAINGNISSASVLLILKKTLEEKKFRPGDVAVLLAMGPGFCAEVVLLKW